MNPKENSDAAKRNWIHWKL